MSMSGVQEMTSPDVIQSNGHKPDDSPLRSNGLFVKEGRNAEKVREELSAKAIQLFQRAQSDRWRQERQWYLNMAFYSGHQYVKFRHAQTPGGTNFDMYVPPAPYYRVRPVINHIRKVVRKEISRLTKQKPNAYVIPASTEDRDVFAAQAGEQIWNALWRQKNLNRILRQAVFWQAVCGNGFIKQWWDWTAYDKFNQQYGDIAITPETPFHVFVPDLKAENLEDQPWLIHAQVRPKEWVKRNLGVEADSHRFDIIDESLLNIMGINQQGEHRRDTTIVLEVWCKPGSLDIMPEGGVFTVANSQVVQGFENWPFSHERYPFSKLDGVPSGKFYNTSIVEDVIPLQRELNRSRGQIVENKNKMAKLQLLYEEGSLDPSRITTEPGQAIPYRQGFNKPEHIVPPPLPAYVENEVNRIYTDIADLSGQHEVSEGKVPAGVTAATAISFLEEQDESLIAPHYDSLEEAIENTAFQCLSYVKDFWDMPRTIRFTGVDRTFDVQTFKGSDLRDNTDIRAEAGSSLPTSRAAKQAFIMDIMKMGFIDPQEGLEVLEIGGLNRIYERVQVDARQAQRENLKMRTVKQEDIQRHKQLWLQKQEQVQKDPTTGLPLEPPLIVPVNSWDNHQVHIEYHNRYRKSQNFEMADTVTRALFEEHVKQHQDALMVSAATGIPQDMQNPLQPPEGGEVPPEQQQQQQGQSGPVPEIQTETGGPVQ